MMHVSVGRIYLRSGANRLWFLWHGAFAYIQEKLADGVISASVYREDGRTFWILSVWTSPEAMLAYRNSGSHLRVMKISRHKEATVDFLNRTSDTVPTWESARRRLIDHVERVC